MSAVSRRIVNSVSLSLQRCSKIHVFFCASCSLGLGIALTEGRKDTFFSRMYGQKPEGGPYATPEVLCIFLQDSGVEAPKDQLTILVVPEVMDGQVPEETTAHPQYVVHPGPYLPPHPYHAPLPPVSGPEALVWMYVLQHILQYHCFQSCHNSLILLCSFWDRKVDVGISIHQQFTHRGTGQQP